MEEENSNVVMWHGPTKKVHNKVHAQSLRLLLFVFCALVKVHTPALQKEVKFADADAVLLPSQATHQVVTIFLGFWSVQSAGGGV